jgi:hypothetical protein
VITKIHEFPSYDTKIQVARYAKHLEGLIADLIGRILALERAAMDDAAVVVRFVKFYEGLGLTDTVTIIQTDYNDSFMLGLEFTDGNYYCHLGVTTLGEKKTITTAYSGGGN